MLCKTSPTSFRSASANQTLSRPGIFARQRFTPWNAAGQSYTSNLGLLKLREAISPSFGEKLRDRL